MERMELTQDYHEHSAVPYNLCRHVIHRRADLSVVTTTARLIPHTLTHELRYHSIQKGKALELKLILHSSCFFSPIIQSEKRWEQDPGPKEKGKCAGYILLCMYGVLRGGMERTCPTTKTISRVYYLYICNKVPLTIVSN